MPRPADPRAKIELLRAAEAVFVEHGLSAAKVEDITARAGVSKGAFYLHFGSKDDCWRHIVEAFVAKLATCLDVPLPSGASLGPAEFGALLVTWHAHDLEVFEFCWQNRGLMRLLFSSAAGSQYEYLSDEFAERISDQVRATVRLFIGAGIYRRDVEPDVLAAMIAGGYERLVRDMIRLPERPDIAHWTRQAQALLTRGLVTDEVRAVLDRGVSVEQRGDARPVMRRPRTARAHPTTKKSKGAVPEEPHPKKKTRVT